MQVCTFFVFIAIVVIYKYIKIRKMFIQKRKDDLINNLRIMQKESGEERAYEQIIESLESSNGNYLKTIEESTLSESEKIVLTAFLQKKYSKELEKERLGILSYKKLISGICGTIAFGIVAIYFLTRDNISLSFMMQIILAVAANVFVKGFVSLLFEYFIFRKENPVNKDNTTKDNKKRSPIEFFCDVMEYLLTSK